MTRAAFTLIELLIVVAIIGILAAVAVPQFQNAILRAKIAGTQLDLKMFVEAMQQYHMDHNSYHAHRDTANQHFPLTTPVAYLPHFLPDRFQHRTDTSGIAGLQYTHSFYHWIPRNTHTDLWGRKFRRADPGLYQLLRGSNYAGLADGWGPAVIRGGPRYAPSNGLISSGGFVRTVPKGKGVHILQ